MRTDVRICAPRRAAMALEMAMETAAASDSIFPRAPRAPSACAFAKHSRGSI